MEKVNVIEVIVYEWTCPKCHSKNETPVDCEVECAYCDSIFDPIVNY